MHSGRLSRRLHARRRRTITTLCVGLASSCLLAACGGGDKVVTSAQPQLPVGGVSTALPLTLAGQWPLTGETLDGDPPDHPVYVVKIDNTSSSAPQVGLGSADMVVEELVEGGLTRLAVFFESDIPDVVGPVRSMRASDVGIVKPAAATIVASGAAKRTTRLLSAHHVPVVTEAGGGPGFYRDSLRSAPYDLFMKLPDLVGNAATRFDSSTKPYLPFGSADNFSGDLPVRKISATFSGSHTTSWQYTDQGWVRPDSFAQNGDDFVADNVLLLRVRVGDAGYRDPIGNPVPETKFYGTGQAILVHGDSALRCVWRKENGAAELHLLTKDGASVDVPAGRTWIELVPADTGTVTMAR